MSPRNLYWAPAYDHMKFFEPKRSTKLAGAYDLYLPRDTLIEVGAETVIDLNMLCLMPEDERGQLRMRSSLARMYRMQVLGGTIDADYPKSWTLIIDTPAQVIERDERAYYDPTACAHYLQFKAGERIAQVCFELVPQHQDQGVLARERMLELHSARGSERSGGFGSTGA